MNINPGMLCFLVNTEPWFCEDGRVVTVVGPYRDRDWVIDGECLPPPAPHLFWVARNDQLRPIHDPDAPAIEDETEALDDEIQRVRQMAGLCK